MKSIFLSILLVFLTPAVISVGKKRVLNGTERRTFITNSEFPLAAATMVMQEELPYQHAEISQLVVLVKNAGQLVKTMGEKVFDEFRVSNSPWRKGENYVFVVDLNGNMLVHPNPELEGRNQLNLKDINGKPIIRGMLEEAQIDTGKPEGWYHYQWPKPGGTKPLWKSTFVKLVKAPSGKSYLVASGIYTDYLEKAFVADAVNKAVVKIELLGERAYPLFKDPAGPYRVKDAYLFIISSQGIEQVNPVFPQYVGKNVLDLKDTQGKLIIKEALEIAKSKGSGWVEYMWPKPGEKTASRKSSFVRKAKLGKNWVAVGCGVYL